MAYKKQATSMVKAMASSSLSTLLASGKCESGGAAKHQKIVEPDVINVFQNNTGHRYVCLTICAVIVFMRDVYRSFYRKTQIRFLIACFSTFGHQRLIVHVSVITKSLSSC